MRWDPRSADYASLAASVAQRAPDAVFVSGLLDTNGGAVIKALRRALPPSTQITAGDGLLPISILFRSAGAAARNVLVSVAGLLPSRLGPAGRTFVRDFAATQPDPSVHEQTVYAAAAAAALLDAIAASDGKRASVTTRLRAQQARRGILGTFRFDTDGDVVPSPITVVRAHRGGGSDAVESTDGATVEQVIQPPTALMQ
jgi:ABC-type branched-subunit amino acid transport system substrate-binding protein